MQMLFSSENFSFCLIYIYRKLSILLIEHIYKPAFGIILDPLHTKNNT